MFVFPVFVFHPSQSGQTQELVCSVTQVVQPQVQGSQVCPLSMSHSKEQVPNLSTGDTGDTRLILG